MVPTEVRQLRLVRRHSGTGHEVGPGDENNGLPSFDRHGHDLVGGFGSVDGVMLADAEHVSADDREVGEPVTHRDDRFGRQRHRRLFGIEPVHALVRPVGEEQPAPIDRPGPAAVFVHAGAGREPLGQDIDRGAVGATAHDLDLAGGLGPELLPPDLIAIDPRFADHGGSPSDQLARDRTRPGPVPGGRHHGQPRSRRSAMRVMPSPRSSSPSANDSRA